jgi:hypothetical protein
MTEIELSADMVKVWARSIMKDLYLDALFRIRMSFLSEEWRKLCGTHVQTDIDYCVKHIEFARKHDLLNYYKMKENCL